ncbi:hypothetical protein AU184_23215 [Mycolicibacterium novocastrense]|uniref:hypothetical protein n=1 Tax=Mycolicibacterium novocastrense TaxID=59813 RepID=UPI0007478BFE|nr:hypothetical protein [Mycolicibacterium novocastrense]KUH67922.1 hypothetical protein AU072_25285 [Mycolicibacterium novocastrense]KUH68395.1 hypothetical protein AU184_23215 [Mycolicibacterium novocastrense]KUH73474.1 hypothetical protein AU183_24105 [Mycolicibacterium novocastrense]
MTRRKVLRGTELRHVLTMYLAVHGATGVDALIRLLDHHFFTVDGRPSKTVSDALRWEVRRGRVRRLRRGHYGPGAMPRSTEHYIHRRVMALREEAAALAADDESDSFWNRLCGDEL